MTSQDPKMEFQPTKPSHTISIFCQLCKGYIVNSKTVSCGHVFCSYCLDHHFLFTPNCPQCATPARETPIFHNFTLDKFIAGYLKKFRPQDYEAHLRELDLQKQYKRQQRKTEIYAGDKIDIRDSDYLWQKALVLRTFMKNVSGRVKILKVRYLDSGIEEELLETSPRIAPEGFFTDLTRTPKRPRELRMVRNSHECYLYGQE